MKVLMIVAGIASLATPVLAGDVKSVFTEIDLKKCKQTEKADNEVFAGAWHCKGYGGYDVFIRSGDDRDSVAFGKSDDKNCSGMKSFNHFNAAGSKIEWRVKDAKPIAAILRWTVSLEPDSTKQGTWLVVNKLDNGSACQMHYVNGSFPNANDAARKAADEKADGFVCETGIPTYDSSIGEPGISLEPCKALAE